jgi:recombination protein RecA
MANEIEKRIKEKLGVGPRIDADPKAPSDSSNPSNPSNPSNGQTANGRAATPSTPSRTPVTIPGAAV